MSSDLDKASDFKLREGERLDDLVRGGLRIIQSPGSFCFSMDAVLLANFASVKKGDRVIDLGTGTAVIPLLISARTQVSKIVGLEIQEESVERACRTVQGNGLDGLIDIIRLNMCGAEKELGAGQFDLVVSNPPYLPVGRGEQNRTDPIAIAKHELCCNLESVVYTASRLVRYGGRVAMVHRPDRLHDLIIEMNKCQLFPRRLQLVYPRPTKKPNMVLLEAHYGSKPELVILEPFIVYNEKGVYTEQYWHTYYPGMPYPY